MRSLGEGEPDDAMPVNRDPAAPPGDDDYLKIMDREDRESGNRKGQRRPKTSNPYGQDMEGNAGVY